MDIKKLQIFKDPDCVEGYYIGYQAYNALSLVEAEEILAFIQNADKKGGE